MQKDTVADLLASVEKDCTANNILICYGSIEENELSPISNLVVDGNWEHFLKVLQALQARVIVIEVDKNENRDYDLLQEQISNLNDVSREEVYSEALSEIKKHDGQMASFAVSFVANLIKYQIKIEADWCDEYELLEGLHLLEDDDDDDEAAATLGLSPDQVEKMSRVVANSPEYGRAKTSGERHRSCLAMDMIKKLDSYSDRIKVINSAENIFLDEVYPIVDKEIGIKIQQLKSKGLNKSQVKARLNISQNTLYRHWDGE